MLGVVLKVVVVVVVAEYYCFLIIIIVGGRCRSPLLFPGQNSSSSFFTMKLPGNQSPAKPQRLLLATRFALIFYSLTKEHIHFLKIPYVRSKVFETNISRRHFV